MPIGGRSIPSDVPVAVFWLKPQRKTNAGTTKTPPDNPNIPETAPTNSPIRRNRRNAIGKAKPLLQAQRLAAQEHGDVRVGGSALDDRVGPADAVGGVAVLAEAGRGARGGKFQPPRVSRRGNR